MREKRVLLVEDDANDEALTLRELTKNNIANEIIIARDGAEALDRLLGTSHSVDELPEVVLLDLKLPKVDGLEVLRRIRANERTQHLPVVVLTASEEDRDRIQAYSLGVNGYVRKPVGFGEFGAATRELGLYWLLTSRRPFRGTRWQPIVV